MNQTPSHSQTSELDANKSQTTECSHTPSTGILYQPPKAEEMRPSRRAQLEADAKDFGIFIVFAFVAWLLISFFLTAAFGG